MSRHRILIVEDEMVVQLHLQRIISELGHVVVGTAMNTREAIALAEREEPELVLMDIHLADGDDGVDTAQKLVRVLDCAVIFVTAYADESTIQRTTAVGAAGYLVKPFTAPAVNAAISTAVASHGRLRAEREKARALSSILDSMGDALFVVDEMDRISFANPRAAELTGWSAREIDGRDLLEIVNVPVESDNRELRALIGEARDQRSRVTRAGLSIRRKGGAERAVDVEIEPVQDDEAAAAGALLVNMRDRSGPAAAAETPRPARTQKRPFGKGTRLMVYSHDTFGLGHLRRCLSLIRALCARHPEASALLVTGSPMVHRYSMPDGADYVKLPAIRKVESEQYEARTLNIGRSSIRGMRSNLILHTMRDFDPNVLLVDHSPTGSKGELLPALEHLAERGGCTRILGLRDIIDEPESVVDLWRSSGVYDVLREHYDHITVYGNREVYDPLAEYHFPPEVAAKARFVDYVCDHSAPSEAEEADDGKPVIAVTIGGGDGGGETVILPFLEMMRAHRDEIDFRAEILTGPFVGEELMAEMKRMAAGLPVNLRDFIPSTAALYRRAELVVATTGYNTTTDLMLHARRAVLVPRVLYRKEQLIRARRLEEMGLVTCLGPDEATPERLFSAIQNARRDEPLTRARAEGRLHLDGARNFAEFCAGLQVDVRS